MIGHRRSEIYECRKHESCVSAKGEQNQETGIEYLISHCIALANLYDAALRNCYIKKQFQIELSYRKKAIDHCNKSDLHLIYGFVFSYSATYDCLAYM